MEDLSSIFNFISECDCYFLLTINRDFPAGRPLKSLVLKDDKFYFFTTDKNNLHKQLRTNPAVQIVALKSGGYQWIRITGLASECCKDKKDELIELNPSSKKTISLIGIEHYLVFEISILNTEIH